MGKFEKGHNKAGGRQVGLVNKLTKTVKERVLEVFNQLQEDSEANLFNWAKNGSIKDSSYQTIMDIIYDLGLQDLFDFKIQPLS